MSSTPNPAAIFPANHGIWQLIARDTMAGWEDVDMAYTRLCSVNRHLPLAHAHWKEAHKKAAVAVVRASLALGVSAPASAFALADK